LISCLRALYGGNASIFVFSNALFLKAFNSTRSNCETPQLSEAPWIRRIRSDPYAAEQILPLKKCEDLEMQIGS